MSAWRHTRGEVVQQQHALGDGGGGGRPPLGPLLPRPSVAVAAVGPGALTADRATHALRRVLPVCATGTPNCVCVAAGGPNWA